jgi:hypothetical protein
MIGASDEQLDVFNEVWYTMLLNSGEAMKGNILVKVVTSNAQIYYTHDS